jgi:hypothetical protein
MSYLNLPTYLSIYSIYLSMIQSLFGQIISALSAAQPAQPPQPLSTPAIALLLSPIEPEGAAAHQL